jgi:pseudouridine-5'-phosphate glycosidase
MHTHIWSIGGSLAVGLSRGELSELFSYDEETAAKIEKEAAIATAASSSSSESSTTVEATDKKND